MYPTSASVPHRCCTQNAMWRAVPACAPLPHAPSGFLAVLETDPNCANVVSGLPSPTAKHVPPRFCASQVHPCASKTNTWRVFAGGPNPVARFNATPSVQPSTIPSGATTNCRRGEMQHGQERVDPRARRGPTRGKRSTHVQATQACQLVVRDQSTVARAPLPRFNSAPCAQLPTIPPPPPGRAEQYDVPGDVYLDCTALPRFHASRNARYRPVLAQSGCCRA